MFIRKPNTLALVSTADKTPPPPNAINNEPSMTHAWSCKITRTTPRQLVIGIKDRYIYECVRTYTNVTELNQAARNRMARELLRHPPSSSRRRVYVRCNLVHAPTATHANDARPLLSFARKKHSKRRNSSSSILGHQ